MHLAPSPLTPKRLAAFAHDLAMTAAAIVIGYYIRFGADAFTYRADEIGILLATVLPFAAVAYWAFSLYAGIWRFASIPDLVNIVKAVTAVAVFMVVLDFVSRGAIVVPRTIVFSSWFVLMALLGGPRFLYRVYRDQRLLKRGYRTGRNAIPVLIAGSGNEAEIIIRSLETNGSEILSPIGMLSTKQAHIGQRIRNIPVLGHTSDIERIVERLAQRGQLPRRLILTNEALNKERDIEALVMRARKLGLSVERMQRPAIEGPDGDGRIRLTPINIEDLLGRSTRELDYTMIRNLIDGQRVLVTGGGGTVGSELCRQIASMSCRRLIIIEHSEFALYGITKNLQRDFPGVPIEGRLCDIRDRKKITNLIEKYKPDIVFHAAALKHVPIVERHVAEGILTNTVGTVHVADAARKVGAKAMVMISTDKAVQPISVMGATKRAAESYCEALDALAYASGNRAKDRGRRETRFMSVRFGNVLGSSGSVVPLFQEQLERGGPITVTHPDMKRYFMTIKEAVSLVLMASALGMASHERISIYVLDMGEPVRIVDLAEQMIRLAGYEPGRDIRIEFTGVRDGEKLHEELFDSSEPLNPTDLEGILSAEPRSIVPETLIEQIKRLQVVTREGDDEAMLARLSALVPEYAPQRVN
jgi:FlaA1/EpsC-like NDP-sugar epimerase